MAKNIGRISSKSSALFLCDMQEKFRKTIKYYPQILQVSSRLLNASKILDIPVVVTEQYPKGLGPTCTELDVSGLNVFPKTNFSMYIPEVKDHLKEVAPDTKSIILCGLETQVCIQNTALDLLEGGFDVHVIADAVSSRGMPDRMFALQRMKEAGAFITTSESMILSLVGGSGHPRFKEIQKIIWEEAPDSGLLTHKINDGSPV